MTMIISDMFSFHHIFIQKYHNTFDSHPRDKTNSISEDEHNKLL